jgi:hypothetical protein
MERAARFNPTKDASIAATYYRRTRAGKFRCGASASPSTKASLVHRLSRTRHISVTLSPIFTGV